MRKYNDSDQQYAPQMQEYWTNFAKTGDPNGGKLVKWPRFDATARAYMDFTDAGPVAKEEPPAASLRRVYGEPEAPPGAVGAGRIRTYEKYRLRTPGSSSPWERPSRRRLRIHLFGQVRRKWDVTPSVSELPKTYDGILDHLYARAIVLESGNASAALITVDAGGVPDAVWKGVSEQVEKTLGIPARNVLLTATHTHSVPGQTGPDYVRKIVESVKQAKDRLSPARVGYGTGVSYINVNRNLINPKTRRWWEGPELRRAFRTRP